jgi:origin recognition complex subunit 1
VSRIPESFESLLIQLQETNPFTFVEINGLRLPEPTAAYNLLWEAVSGHDVSSDGHLNISSKESLKALTRYFSGSAGRGPGCHAW